MKVTGIEKSIGNTPLIRLTKLVDPMMAEIWVKLESHNPGGSIKDRAALYMIQEAEKAGLLQSGDTIIEPTSGNTGLALAMLAAAKGYRMLLVMPETMSVERQKLARAYGAEVMLTKGEEGMEGAVKLAEDLAKSPGYFLPNQFSNKNNVKAHYETTAVEILRDLTEPIAAFVAGVGTGGTITGIGRRLKEENAETLVIAVEPQSSPILSGGVAANHEIQGIGANFIPTILDQSLIDEIVPVEDQAAFSTARQMGAVEGILCGISGGANVFAALKLAERLGSNKKIVTIVPDSGERYLSTALYDEE